MHSGSAIKRIFSPVFKLCWTAVVVLSFSNHLFGQSKFAGESFSRGVGGRGLAMGSAYVSIAQGASSLYWNPAGMSGLEARELMAMHSESFGGEVDYDYLGFIQPISREPSKSAFGVGVIRLGVSGFQETALPDSTKPVGPGNRPFVVDTFSTADYAFLFGYSREITEELRMGGNVKVLHKSLHEESATGFGFDLGILYKPISLSPIQIGVGFQDATTTFLAFSTGKHERIRPTMRIGASTAGGIRLWNGSFILATDVVFRFEDRGSQVDNFSFGAVSGTYHIGGEYLIDREHLKGLNLALRGGLDEEVPSAGAGIGIGRFRFDYAWLGKVDDDLGTSNRISMSVSL
ncbi:MAG: PorV/PorQ family protein [Candidatus Glassbacteria bacterium]